MFKMTLMYKRFRDVFHTFEYKRFTTSLVPKGFTTFFTVSKKRVGRNFVRHNLLYCPGKEEVLAILLENMDNIRNADRMHVPLEITVI